MPISLINAASQGGVPAFSAYQSSAQTIGTNTFTKVQYQTEEYDTNNNYDNVTNYRFTPTVAGYYQVNGLIGMSSATVGGVLMVYKNGSRYKDGNGTSSGSTALGVSAQVYLNGSTDYIELYCYISVGQNLAAGVSAVFFQAAMIRAA